MSWATLGLSFLACAAVLSLARSGAGSVWQRVAACVATGGADEELRAERKLVAFGPLGESSRSGSFELGRDARLHDAMPASEPKLGQAAAVLRGRVVHEDGSAAGEELLRLSPAHRGLSSFFARGGRYAIRGLAPGTYHLEPMDSPSRRVAVRVEAPETNAPDLVVPRRAALRGRLLLPSSGVEGDVDATLRAQLRLTLHVGPQDQGRIELHDDGRFEGSAPPGPVVLAVWAAGSDEPLFVATASAPASGIELDLCGVLGGMRLDPRGLRPGARIALRIRSLDGARPTLACLLQCGEKPIELRGIVPGRYDVHVQTPAGSGEMAGVAVIAGEVAELGPLELGMGGVRGALRFADGRAAREARVLLRGRDGELRVARADAEGRFRAEQLSAGTWRAAPLLHGIAGAATREARVLPGALAELETFELPELGALRCVVRRDGAPLAGAEVLVTSDEPEGLPAGHAAQLEALATDGAGAARIALVAAGPVRVSISHGDPPQLLAVRRALVPAGETLELAFELEPGHLSLAPMRGPEPFGPLEHAYVVVAGREGLRVEYPGLEGSAVLLGRLPEEHSLLVVCTRLGECRALRLPRSAAAARVELALPAGALLIDPPRAGWLRPPRLVLVDIDGLPVAPWGPPFVVEGRRLPSGAWIFEQVPTGARLELDGLAADGSRVRLTAVQRGEGTALVTL